MTVLIINSQIPKMDLLVLTDLNNLGTPYF